MKRAAAIRGGEGIEGSAWWTSISDVSGLREQSDPDR
jgi:hypothetical protein